MLDFYIFFMYIYEYETNGYIIRKSRLSSNSN